MPQYFYGIGDHGGGFIGVRQVFVSKTKGRMEKYWSIDAETIGSAKAVRKVKDAAQEWEERMASKCGRLD
ncbi:MAG: hypothetical protein C9356_20185 [Oleiphilus sp.]|nr:MAG: hypothetical protein C9356_20185 [Oleiphilus sp.]